MVAISPPYTLPIQLRRPVNFSFGGVMAQPSFWLVMDQDGDGMAESVLPCHAKTEQLAIVEALEHLEGRLIGVVPGDWPMEPDVLCILCSAAPIKP